MIHETLSKKILEGPASSSQTLNTNSNYLSPLAARSTQASHDSLSVRLAAGSTQGLNNGHVENSDPPSRKQSFQVQTRISEMILQFPLDDGMRLRNCLVFWTSCVRISRSLCTTGNKLPKSFLGLMWSQYLLRCLTIIWAALLLEQKQLIKKQRNSKTSSWTPLAH